VLPKERPRASVAWIRVLCECLTGLIVEKSPASRCDLRSHDMGEMPTGTVTFLFTDIEGSTQLVQTLGEEWKRVLEDHNCLVRRAIREANGFDLRTEGDSFFAVFPTAPAAVAAAAAAQRALAANAWPRDASVRIRMHTGVGTVGGDSYVGLDVHRAARIAASGHGGQVLLSSATCELVRAGLPHGLGLRDLGEHRPQRPGAAGAYLSAHDRRPSGGVPGDPLPRDAIEPSRPADELHRASTGGCPGQGASPEAGTADPPIPTSIGSGSVRDSKGFPATRGITGRRAPARRR
jgi:class 3 adenylate cyclase